MATVASTQPRATSARQPRTNERYWLVGLAVLVLIGIAAWAVQLTQGYGVLGVGQAVVWGVYIATFFTMAGIAGGLVIFAALADLGAIPSLQPYRHGMLLGALALFVASGFMILMDIGQPLRVMNMIFSANLTSPFVWDFASLALGVIVTIVYLFSQAPGRWLPALAGAVAVIVLLAEGLILSMSTAGALWHGGMMPVVFLLEGLLAAAAIALIARTDANGSAWLRRFLLVSLPVVVVLNLLEIAAVSYAGNLDAEAAIAIFWSGRLAPLFWGQAVVCIALPFVLLAWAGDSHNTIAIAAVLIILGVFATKLGILVSGQALSFMQTEAVYMPSLVEAGGVIGIVGLAGLLFLLGRRWVPAR